MALLTVKDLTKNFGGLCANSNINLTVDHNELIGLIGPNGAGKTTLFNAYTGASQYVGNWPGVTVEKKEGQ